MAGRTLLRFVTALSIVLQVSSAPYDIEADEFAASLMVTEGRVMPRSGLKNDRSIWLKKGEALKMKFCLNLDAVVSVRNVCWANDGWMDMIVVKINDQIIGNFTTNDQSDWGHLWNVPFGTGPIGDQISLPSGQHDLILEVPNADLYGVEIDKVILEVDGEIQEAGLACVDADDEDSESEQTTDEKALEGEETTEKSSTSNERDPDADDGKFGY